MKDDCYTLTDGKTGKTMEVMVRSGELWLNTGFLSPNQQAALLNSGEEIAVEPEDRISYVRASYYSRIWPEHRLTVNDFARKLGVPLPWPEN